MSLNIVTTNIRGFPDSHITSLHDYGEWVDNVKNKSIMTIFRGQRSNWSLTPRISRDSNKPLVLEQEHTAIEQFKEQAPACLHLLPKTEWDWLVVAQHHGLPTRLLDWSHNPYIGLWFALEKAHINGSKPEVWALKPEKEDIILSNEDTRPYSGTRTKVFNTSFSIPRVKAQMGCFTLFKHVKNSATGFVPLEKNQRLRKRLARVRIAEYAVNSITKQLQDMGYKKSTMFPNIDDVAKSIRSEVFGKKRA